MKRNSVRNLLLIVICVLCGVFAAFTTLSTPTPVTRSGLTNVGAVQIDSCLLIYGIRNGDNSFVAELYDPQLRLVHQFNEKITGFAAHSVTLGYSSDTRLEFTISDQKNLKQKFIFLNKELIAFYKSDVAYKPVVLSSPNVKTLDKYRIDDFSWEIRTETQDIGGPGKATTTTLYQYGIKLLPTGPLMNLNRAIVLDSFAVEYAKVFLVRDNKIYVYVNESAMSGQFVYCLSVPDGSLIYKTKLAVKYPDLNGMGKVKPAQACYYSNCFYNEQTQQLLVSGTWIGESRYDSGIFLLQINNDGKINGSCADYGSRLYRGGVYNSASGFAGNAVAMQTVQRVVDMKYQANGTFVVISEMYGQRLRNWSGQEKGLSMDDDQHHYFCMYVQMFSVTANEIKLPKPSEYIIQAQWKGNHHLDSIEGFVPNQTKLYDKLLANDFNALTESEQALHYSALFLNVNKTGVKVLTRDSVLVSPTQGSTAYFSKLMYVQNNVNCLAMIEPNPVHNQRFSEPAEYFAIDAKHLYRLSKTANGFNLSIQEW